MPALETPTSTLDQRLADERPPRQRDQQHGDPTEQRHPETEAKDFARRHVAALVDDQRGRPPRSTPRHRREETAGVDRYWPAGPQSTAGTDTW